MTYEDALANAHRKGAKASELEAMADFCAYALQTLAGAVSPKLVWEGAKAQGLTLRELAHLAAMDPIGIAALMW